MQKITGLLSLILAFGMNAHICESAQIQADNAELHVTAVLIDSDLQARPVPKHALTLRCASAATIRVVTGFDGIARTSAPGGSCVIESEKGLTFQQKEYRWSIPVELHAGGTIEIELSNDNASIEQVKPTESAPSLPKLFREWQDSIVTVWSTNGHGTGFMLDENGLFLTNEHVIHNSDYIAVQFDANTKVRAVLLAANAEKDVAVLQVNPATTANCNPVILADDKEMAEPLEGESVFTIGSPLNQKKVMTTGIISKVEKQAIISDININHGNSGGPLFSMDGKVLGITTFGDFAAKGGPGISGIVRIDCARDVISEARNVSSSVPMPSKELLPVDPQEAYSSEALKKALSGRTSKSFRDDQYGFSMGDFEVTFQTPVLAAGLRALQDQEIHKEQTKREKRAGMDSSGNAALEELRDWMQYVGENAPVFVIRAAPKLREGFLSGLSRGLAASQGYYAGPAKLNYATDFISMNLYCGDRMVQPIQPNRIEFAHNEQDYSVSVKDAAYYGFYSYPFDAIGPECGNVSLHIFSLKKREEPQEKVVPVKVVQRIWNDFEAYRVEANRKPE